MKAVKGNSVRQGWADALGSIDAQATALLRQAEEAKRQYPALVSAFNTLVCYVVFTHRERVASALLRREPHVEAELGTIPLPTFLDRAPLFLACLNGDKSSCDLLGVAPHPQSGGAMGEAKCDELRTEYQAAKARELEELMAATSAGQAKTPRNHLGLMLAEQKESDRIFEEMLLLGCFGGRLKLKLPLGPA